MNKLKGFTKKITKEVAILGIGCINPPLGIAVSLGNICYEVWMENKLAFISGTGRTESDINELLNHENPKTKRLIHNTIKRVMECEEEKEAELIGRAFSFYQDDTISKQTFIDVTNTIETISWHNLQYFFDDYGKIDGNYDTSNYIRLCLTKHQLLEVIQDNSREGSSKRNIIINNKRTKYKRTDYGRLFEDLHHNRKGCVNGYGDQVAYGCDSYKIKRED